MPLSLAHPSPGTLSQIPPAAAGKFIFWLACQQRGWDGLRPPQSHPPTRRRALGSGRVPTHPAALWRARPATEGLGGQQPGWHSPGVGLLMVPPLCRAPLAPRSCGSAVCGETEAPEGPAAQSPRWGRPGWLLWWWPRCRAWQEAPVGLPGTARGHAEAAGPPPRVQRDGDPFPWHGAHRGDPRRGAANPGVTTGCCGQRGSPAPFPTPGERGALAPRALPVVAVGLAVPDPVPGVSPAWGGSAAPRPHGQRSPGDGPSPAGSPAPRQECAGGPSLPPSGTASSFAAI